MHTVALVNSSARLIEKSFVPAPPSHEDAILRFHHRPEFVDLLHDGAMAVATNSTIVATDMTGLDTSWARRNTTGARRPVPCRHLRCHIR